MSLRHSRIWPIQSGDVNANPCLLFRVSPTISSFVYFSYMYEMLHLKERDVEIKFGEYVFASH